MPKYTTLSQLAEAFKSGELDRRKYYLLIDNGGRRLYLRKYTSELGDQHEDDATRECDALFEREPSSPLHELFGLAGINAEWC